MPEGFLDHPVLAGVKRQDRHSAARRQRAGKFVEKRLEHFKLAVHINAQCLKGALAGLFDKILFLAVVRQDGQCPLDDRLELCGRLYGFPAAQRPDHFRSDLRREGFVRVFHEHSRQLILCQFPQTLCRRYALFRIQPQIKRSLHLVGKSPVRVIDLHGRYPQIRKDKIKRSMLRRDPVDIGKVLLQDCQDL